MAQGRRRTFQFHRHAQRRAVHCGPQTATSGGRLRARCEAVAMKTRVHTYHFDLTKEAQRAEYRELCDKLVAFGLDKFDALGELGGRELRLADGMELALDPAHLFDNQWNTAP